MQEEISLLKLIFLKPPNKDYYKSSFTININDCYPDYSGTIVISLQYLPIRKHPIYNIIQDHQESKTIGNL